jgi:vitamin B12 transporter
MRSRFRTLIPAQPRRILCDARSAMHPIHPAVRAAACGFVLAATAVQAQQPTTTVPTCTYCPVHNLGGVIRDPLGAGVPNATVELLLNDPHEHVLATIHSGPHGEYDFDLTNSGLYRFRVSAPTFRTVTTPPVYLSPKHPGNQDITLATPTLTQEVSVTTGTPTPLAQSGAPITILPQADFANTLEIQDPLRLVPGVQITTEGQAGGESSLFLRGGNSEFTKVLIDGVPVNDIGSVADLSTLASTGIAQIEVLRQPVSVLYGSDNVAGVVSLTTQRGSTPLPLLTYSVDGGNLGTLRQQVSLAGAHSHFDYDTGFAAFQTSNSTPDDDFHNTTEFGNYGFDPDSHTDLRFTFRHIDTNTGDPNAYAFYGIPDFVNQFYQETFLNGTAQQQTTPNWHNLLRFGWQALNYDYVQYGTDGTYDPNVYATIGNPVTITGANGYSVSGQAVLDYPDGSSPTPRHPPPAATSSTPRPTTA